jgi:predicted deacylase
MKKSLSIVFVCFLAIAKTVFASGDLDFTLHKLESGQPGATLLVVGGIQGDEPGGFNAASLLVTNYKIRKGSVWVVPNLNFISIIKRTRGVHGDLNRKFASIKHTDPELDTIEKIKAIILNDQVDVILNLHDGSGFYRPYYIDRRQARSRPTSTTTSTPKNIPTTSRTPERAWATRRCQRRSHISRSAI